MKKIYFFTIVVFLHFTVVFISGCDKPQKNSDLQIPDSQKISENFDYGSWTGSTYKNDFFGLSISVPEDWHVADQERMKVLRDKGQNADFLDKEKSKKASELAEITTAVLFTVFRYTIEEAVEKRAFNPNISLCAENLSIPGKKIDLAYYIKEYREGIFQSAPGAVIKSETTKVIGGREFTSLHVIPDPKRSASLEYLIYMEKNFAVVFSIIWLDDSEKEQLDAMMATLKWE